MTPLKQLHLYKKMLDGLSKEKSSPQHLKAINPNELSKEVAAHLWNLHKAEVLVKTAVMQIEQELSKINQVIPSVECQALEIPEGTTYREAISLLKKKYQ